MKVGLWALVLLAAAFSSRWNTAEAAASCPAVVMHHPWPGGRNGNARFQVPANLNGWKLVLTFDRPVTRLNPYNGMNAKCDGNQCSFTNQGYNKKQKKGASMDLGFGIDFNGSDAPEVVSAQIVKNKRKTYELCESSPSVPTTRPKPAPTTRPKPAPRPKPSRTTTKPAPASETTENPGEDSGNCNTVTNNYKEVLKLSLLFYEAQRSGKLPSTNRVPWRKDSALKDGKDVGMDLTGGYYDAGDYVKFGFPMAYTVTTLAWGGITFRKGYENAGQFEYLKEALKWGTDFFIKAHPKPNVLYGQVGDGNVDHSWVGRPEDMTMRRPSMKIDASNPGSDLAGETAAAMAATAILFKDSDSSYSAELIKHAKELFDFADKYRREYHISIPNAANFYRSWSGYKDELVWAAIWLYKATKEEKYLKKAKSMYNEFNLDGSKDVLSWDNKKVGVYALMAEALPNEAKYQVSLKNFCDSLMNGVQKSPKGQLWFGQMSQWGSLRYASNAAFVCLQAAELIPSKDKAYTNIAKEQMDYILGKTGRSFVVGYGPNSPQKPHHRASTCPDAPKPCDWNTFKGPQKNAHVLKGALVGGPKAADDRYTDDRNDYIMNEVATDYNAGFQGVLAGLHMKKCM